MNGFHGDISRSRRVNKFKQKKLLGLEVFNIDIQTAVEVIANMTHRRNFFYQVAMVTKQVNCMKFCIL